MRRLLITLLLASPLLGQAPNGWAPIENGWAEIQTTASTGTVTTTGTLASGQVALGSGATSITGDAGFLWTGTGPTFFATLGGGVRAPLFSGGPAATGTNIAGTTTTVAGQLGTGTGASGDQVFTVGTPQASGTGQHVAATALTLHNAGSAGTAAPQVLFADGTAAAPSISFGSEAMGFYREGSSSLGLSLGGGYKFMGFSGAGLDLLAGLKFSIGGDTLLSRAAAATWRLGAADDASPVSQTLQSQGSRGGTDTNVAGGNLTIRPGAGTGSATGSSIVFQTPTAGASGTTGQTQTTRMTVTEPAVVAAVPIRLAGYTVATLPAGTVGDTAYVTDATAPTYLGALTGGGAVVTPVFYNGTAWVSH